MVAGMGLLPIAPILLLPLRLETRFKQFGSPDGTLHQLWVRVFPDDCAVDTRLRLVI